MTRNSRKPLRDADYGGAAIALLVMLVVFNLPSVLRFLAMVGEAIR